MEQIDTKKCLNKINKDLRKIKKKKNYSKAKEMEQKALILDKN